MYEKINQNYFGKGQLVKHSLKSLILALALLLGFIVLAQGNQQQNQPGEEVARKTVNVAVDDTYGQYLTDGLGMALYTFTADKQAGESSACTGECADRWLSYIAEGAEGELTAGDGVDESLLSFIVREDGTRQVTYSGWPLYYYVGDENPGDTTQQVASVGDVSGQGLEGFGGTWYLISPAGKQIDESQDGNS